VHIILEQQVSIAAARTMYRRLADHLGGVHPEGVRGMGVQGLRRFGLTRQKAGYCHALALRVLSGRLDLSAVARASDDAARRMLLEVPGLGPWSADIYTLMALRRPDIWPRGDLALASALRDIMGLPGLPTAAEQHALTAPWSPWRSVAARILWSHYLSAQADNRRRKGAPP
jgi:DNA-3-methyladenine glycosylase II